MIYPVTLPPDKADASVWLGREHGIACWNLDGQQWADREDAQDLIDAWDPLPEAKDKLKAALDKERRKRVARVAADDDAKFLSLAEFDELLFLDSQVGELTTDQQNLRSALLGAWNTVLATRTAAAQVAADIDALPDMAAAQAFSVQAAFDARLAEGAG